MSVSLGLNDPDDFLCQVGGYEECWELCRGRSSSRGGGALIFSCLDSQLRDDLASWIRPDARVSVALKEHHGCLRAKDTTFRFHQAGGAACFQLVAPTARSLLLRLISA